jgi:hypothetical protein
VAQSRALPPVIVRVVVALKEVVLWSGWLALVGVRSPNKILLRLLLVPHKMNKTFFPLS